MSNVIVITSGKGGTGKTSFAANVGMALAQMGHPTLCLDCDVGLRNLDIALCMTDRAVMDFTDVLSGRCTLNWDVRCPTEKVGDFDVECAREFWLGFARSVPATLHFVQFAGGNSHHILEACWKGMARALAAAVQVDQAHRDEIPSTKGLLV